MPDFTRLTSLSESRETPAGRILLGAGAFARRAARHHYSDFAAKVYDVVTPGTTIVVTDAPALPNSSSHREVLLMKAEQK